VTIRPEPDEAAQLLAAQLDDLARYRHVVEAQRAVLRMGDAGLLETFGAEAQGIISGISAREVRLLAIRAAAQPDTHPHPATIAELQEKVTRAKAAASAEALALAYHMESEKRGVARAIRETTAELEQSLSGYSRRTEPGTPVLFDRTG
jgi:hypothetical protein